MKVKTSKSINAIFQVRMGSTRLPGKSLIDIEGKPLLKHVLDRVKKSSFINNIILATTNKDEDQIFKQFALKENIKIFFGSENDVLDRFYQASTHYPSDIIVRITPDDPFKDPEVIDQALEILLDNYEDYDYVTNTLLPSYPIGLDIEVFKSECLRKAWKEANLLSEREHVTPYIWKNKDKFNIYNFSLNEDLSNYHWTLDTPNDLIFTREIYKRIYKIKPDFLMRDILYVLNQEPDLLKINANSEKFAGYIKSIENDRIITNGVKNE